MPANPMKRLEHQQPVQRAADAMKKIANQDVQLNIRVPITMKRELRKLAAEHDTTITEILTSLIEEHLKTCETKNDMQ